MHDNCQPVKQDLTSVKQKCRANWMKMNGNGKFAIFCNSWGEYAPEWFNKLQFAHLFCQPTTRQTAPGMWACVKIKEVVQPLHYYAITLSSHCMQFQKFWAQFIPMISLIAITYPRMHRHPPSWEMHYKFPLFLSRFVCIFTPWRITHIFIHMTAANEVVFTLEFIKCQ